MFSYAKTVCLSKIYGDIAIYMVSAACFCLGNSSAGTISYELTSLEFYQWGTHCCIYVTLFLGSWYHQLWIYRFQTSPARPWLYNIFMSVVTVQISLTTSSPSRALTRGRLTLARLYPCRKGTDTIIDKRIFSSPDHWATHRCIPLTQWLMCKYHCW